MEALVAVEKEIDKILSKFSSIREHGTKNIDETVQFLSSIKPELEQGIVYSTLSIVCHAECLLSYQQWTFVLMYIQTFLSSKALAGTDISEHQLFISQHAVSKVKETISRLASEHRDLHSSVSKVGKTIDRVRISCYFLSVDRCL